MRIYPHFLQGTVLINLSLLLGGCISVDPYISAQKIASDSGLTSEKFDTELFPIVTWHRITPPVHSLRVYIEGDGFAWKSRTTPSDNPTPRNPTGLKLAAADKQANVFYLSRPCQYIGPPLPANCRVNIWTQDRFSPVVIDAMSEALNQIVLRYPGVQLDLVGYSGGGNIAALLAERRSDVRSLRTVAGNLDVAYVNAIHHVTPMPTAENAIDHAPALRALPQIHYSGGADTTVPPAVARRFQQALGGKCVQTEVVSGMEHGSDWGAVWPELLAQGVPEC